MARRDTARPTGESRDAVSRAQARESLGARAVSPPAVGDATCRSRRSASRRMVLDVLLLLRQRIERGPAIERGGALRVQGAGEAGMSPHQLGVDGHAFAHQVQVPLQRIRRRHVARRAARDSLGLLDGENAIARDRRLRAVGRIEHVGKSNRLAFDGRRRAACVGLNPEQCFDALSQTLGPALRRGERDRSSVQCRDDELEPSMHRLRASRSACVCETVRGLRSRTCRAKCSALRANRLVRETPCRTYNNAATRSAMAAHEIRIVGERSDERRLTRVLRRHAVGDELRRGNEQSRARALRPTLDP